jgi:hypothetical protein
MALSPCLIAGRFIDKTNPTAPDGHLAERFLVGTSLCWWDGAGSSSRQDPAGNLIELV